MALDVEQVVKVPVQAWVQVADGTQFEVTSLECEYSADRAACRATFAVGVPIGAGQTGAQPQKQITNQQALSLKLDTPVQVWVQAESSVALPGLPTAATLLLDGYIVDSGPWRISGTSNEFGYGIEIVHRDTANLTTGSTAAWPWTTSINFDWKRPVSTLDSMWMTAMLSQGTTAMESIKASGLWETFRAFFSKIAEGPQDAALDNTSLVGALALNPGCGGSGSGEVSRNQVALEALARVDAATPFTIEADDIQKFISFLDQSLQNDMRTMNFLKQIQYLGDQCFFRVVPKADGSLLVVPFKTFEATPLLELSSDQIFGFRPSAAGNTRVAGVLLFGSPVTHSVFEDEVPIFGCYTFDAETVSPRGVIEAVPAPSWLGPNAYPFAEDSRNNFQAVVEASEPNANAVPENPIVESYLPTLERYGNLVAREMARQFRFRDSSATFASYLRTDIGPHSTVRVQAPGTIGDETALFGKIDRVRIIIDGGSQSAMTDFTMAYARNGAVQESINDFTHPLFGNESYPGGPL